MTSVPSLGPRGEGWVVLQFVLLGVIGSAGPLGGPAWDGLARLAGLVAGLVLLSLGGVLAARGLFDLRDALTPLPHPRDDAELVETGIYARARHPIYGGLILASFGWSLAWASPVALALAVVLAVFFLLKSTREEHWLAARFPAYEAYQARTRRFIPWIG